jgi:acetyl-CoA acyltransferase
MSKQIQDAYIVAATRTPIGRSHRGYFRNTRPDDLLAAALRCRAGAGAGAGPKAIEDVICGCAIPEGSKAERGAHRRGAGRAAQQRGRHHRQPLLRIGPVRRADGGRPHPRGRSRCDDRRWRTESMSMVPMMGNSPSLSPQCVYQYAMWKAMALPTAWA